MSYIDVQHQLDKMEDDLYRKMKDEKIIDEHNRAVKVTEFVKLLNEGIDKMNIMLRDFELEGYYDANTYNIIQSRMTCFMEMIGNRAFALSPDEQSTENPYEDKLIADLEKRQAYINKLKQMSFLQAIKYMFGRDKPVRPDIPKEKD